VHSPASGGLGDLAAALPALPLFPLPTVLFPGALLPLHVFEPRYRAMVRDALATHGALAVVLVIDPEAKDAEGQPRIASIAGAGVILDHVEHPNGRFDILVRGRARVHLDELPFGDEARHDGAASGPKPRAPAEPRHDGAASGPKPYRRARATVITPPEIAADPTDVAALVAAASAFAARVREREPGFKFSLPKDASPALVADLCAHHLVLDARERQRALETLHVGVRLRRVAEILALQHLALTPGASDLN
jgi:ATP-dependent Lon protease